MSMDTLAADLKMVLDGGECQKGIESTIVGFENGEPTIYRLGIYFAGRY